jgi:hypothetical protein
MRLTCQRCRGLRHLQLALTPAVRGCGPNPGSVEGDDTSGDGTLYAYGLASPPTGSQTVSATLSGTNYAVGCSVSYTDVGSVGSAQITYGTGPTSQSVTCSSGQTISPAYGIYGAYFAASLVGTERYNGSSSGEAGLLISDAHTGHTPGVGAFCRRPKDSKHFHVSMLHVPFGP